MVRRRVYIVSALGLVLATAVGVLAQGNKAVAIASDPVLPPIVTAESTNAPLPTSHPGQTLMRSSESSALDAAAAVEKAKEDRGTGIFASGRVIVVGKYRFSDDTMADAIIPRNALVWIVSVDGIVMPTPSRQYGSSGPPDVIHQMNFVLDANTGAKLVAYAGQVAPQTPEDVATMRAAAAGAPTK
jgi:hypothetical protein